VIVVRIFSIFLTAVSAVMLAIAFRRFWQLEQNSSAISRDRPPIKPGLKERLILWAWVEGIILGIALIVWSFLA
jgi:hypothetical protein